MGDRRSRANRSRASKRTRETGAYAIPWHPCRAATLPQRRQCGSFGRGFLVAPGSIRGQSPGGVDRFVVIRPWPSRPRVTAGTATALVLKTITKQSVRGNRRWPPPDGSAPRHSTRWRGPARRRTRGGLRQRLDRRTPGVWPGPNGAAARCAAVAGRHRARAGLGAPELASSACSSRRAEGLERADVDDVVVEAELVAAVAVRAAEDCDAPHAAAPHP